MVRLPQKPLDGMKNLIYLAPWLALAGCGNGGYEKVGPGLEMKKLENGTGRGMQNGTDYFYVSAHVMDENDKPYADASFDPHFYYVTQLKEPAYSYDFVQALPGLKMGDSVSIQTLPDSLFLFYYGVQAPAQLAGSPIHLHLKLVNVMTEEEYYAKLERAKEESKNTAFAEFETYLQQHHIATEPIGTGTIKVTTTPGEGADAFYGDVVSIHMVQKLLDGTEIENTHKAGAPYEYEIGGGSGLKGLDEALMKMKKGEKATVYLPYFLAFGEAGQPPRIPPYANLMMELELLEIRKPYN